METVNLHHAMRVMSTETRCEHLFFLGYYLHGAFFGEPGEPSGFAATGRV
jgi:hypothetical protein